MSQLPTSHSRNGGHQGPETFLAPYIYIYMYYILEYILTYLSIHI